MPGKDGVKPLSDGLDKGGVGPHVHPEPFPRLELQAKLLEARGHWFDSGRVQVRSVFGLGTVTVVSEPASDQETRRLGGSVTVCGFHR